MNKTLMVLVGRTGGWKRRVAALAAGLAVAGGLSIAEGVKPDPSRLVEQKLSISSRPLKAFDRAEPARASFGDLEWAGGLVLSSPSPNFGGWSGLDISPDGKRVLAVSDAGTWMSAELVYEGSVLSSVKGARIGPLRARDGRVLPRRRDRDAEALVIEEGEIGKGTALIAFEQNDRIGRFPLSEHGIGAPTQYLEVPPAVQAMRGNGLESVAVLRGGRLNGAVIAIGERASREGRNPAWVWVGGKAQALEIGGADGFDITDAKGLPDGGLLLIERRFRWLEGVKLRVSRVAGDGLVPGGRAKREVLLSADMGKEIDNMEGLAVHQDSSGRTVLTLISDDNFSPLLQRTILLQFRLSGGSTSAKDGPRSPQSADAH